MQATCCKCTGKFMLTADELDFYQELGPEDKYDFAMSTICWFCAQETRSPSVTVLGVLACHVRHISGKVVKNRIVSRETID